MTARVRWLGVLFLLQSFAPAHAAARDDLSGIWRVKNPVFAAKTLDGARPPLKPEALPLYQERQRLRRQGNTSFDSSTWCASPGIPRLMLVDHPFEIVVRPQQVLFLYEWNRWARLVDLSGMTLDIIDPSSMGVAMGRWQGETLVIETIGLKERTFLDSAGLPHSEDAKVTERLRLQSPDVLEDLISIDDPAFYSRPWQMRVLYQRQAQQEIREDTCLDRIKAGEAAIKGE